MSAPAPRAWLARALALFALYAAPCLAQPEQATPEPFDWRTAQYGYAADNESLRSLLYDFGTTLDIPVVVSSKITDIVDDRIPVMSGERFLAEIHARFGVLWVYDGTTLYLYNNTEAQTSTVEFPFHRRSAFKSAIDVAGVVGAPLGWVFLPAENSVQLSGPPRFVEWAEKVAETLAAGGSVGSLDPLSPEQDDRYAIRVFRVEYGYVDTILTDDAEGSASPGQEPIERLAEMIAKLMNVSHELGVVSSGAASGSAAGGASGGVAKMRGTGIIGGETAEQPAEPASAPAPAPPGVSLARGAGQESFVIGDPRLNAIIVRDLKHRMPVYEQLIAELDTPVDQIEVAVAVLDVDASAAEEFRLDVEGDSFRFSPGNDEGSTIQYSKNMWDIESVAVRLRALRNNSKSRVLTQPSVMTLDNQEASFRNDRTFYVRLGGNDAEAVDLAPVSYGWVVRIRPHVVYEGTYKRVQLTVHIQDGNRGGANLAVTGVPEVAQNVIKTQAVVNEGNSLLIGGYQVREQTRFQQRVPLLGRIPFAGRLFSSKIDRDQSIARYFLITPRVVPVTIAYEINTGFEGDPVIPADLLRELQDPAEPEADAGATPRARSPRVLSPPPDAPRQVAPQPQPAQPAQPAGDAAADDDDQQAQPSTRSAAEATADENGGQAAQPRQSSPAERTTDGDDADGAADADGEATGDRQQATPAGATALASSARPAKQHAVQLLALSSAERLDAFVEANGLQDMIQVRSIVAGQPRYLLIEGIYPDFASAKQAADRVSDAGLFESPFIRNMRTLQGEEPAVVQQ